VLGAILFNKKHTRIIVIRIIKDTMAQTEYSDQQLKGKA